MTSLSCCDTKYIPSELKEIKGNHFYAIRCALLHSRVRPDYLHHGAFLLLLSAKCSALPWL